MKKIICVLFLITLIFMSSKKQESVIIPKESIRFRLIANSNSIEDQTLKKTIKKDLETNFIQNLSTNNISNTEKSIKESLNIIDNVMRNYNVNYDVSYGNNYFPEKEYKGVKYPEGKYKSLVITLGEGNGDNWWCVLFPPLCLMETDNNADDIEYKFYVQNILDKISNQS